VKINVYKKFLLIILIINLVYSLIYYVSSISNEFHTRLNSAIPTSTSISSHTYRGIITNITPFTLSNFTIFVKIFDSSNKYITSFFANSDPNILMPGQTGYFDEHLDKVIPKHAKSFFMVTSMPDNEGFGNYFNLKSISTLIIVVSLCITFLAFLGLFISSKWIYVIILVWEISLSLMYLSSLSYVASFFYDEHIVLIKKIIWFIFLSYIIFATINAIAVSFAFKIYNSIEKNKRNNHYLLLIGFSIGLLLILYFYYRISYTSTPFIIMATILVTFSGWIILRRWQIKISLYLFELHKNRFGIHYFLNLLKIKNNLQKYKKENYYFFLGKSFNESREILYRSFVPWILVLLLSNSLSPFLQNYAENMNYSLPFLKDHLISLVAIILIIFVTVFFILPLSTIDLSHLYLKQEENGITTSVYQEFNKVLSIIGISIIFNLLLSSELLFHLIFGMIDINDLWISIYNLIILIILTWIPFYLIFLLYM
jgi:hypothetical protein